MLRRRSRRHCGTHLYVPKLEPFAALRYDPSTPLDDLIAPPYDVVGPEERAKLASRHRANSIHVELPVEDPASDLDKYRAAERLLDSWVKEGLLRRDDVPSMYPYRMTGPDNATTTGIIGALGLRATGRRHLAPRTDDPEGQERPSRAVAHLSRQPLPHLGAVARPRA